MSREGEPIYRQSEHEIEYDVEEYDWRMKRGMHARNMTKYGIVLEG